MIAMFSLFGLVLGVCNYEYGIQQTKDVLDPEVYPDPMQDPRNSTLVS